MAHLRLVQSGRGERRDLVVVAYLGSYADQSLRAAAPDAAIVNLTTTPTAQYCRIGAGSGGIHTIEAIKSWAAAEARVLEWGRLVLLGYSAGCQGVRSWLQAGVEPDAVVAVDGTHSGTVARPEQIEPYERQWSRALHREAVLVASHTMIEPRDYASTHTTLERITGWELPGAELDLYDPPKVRKSGLATVWSYGGDVGEAHTMQARTVAGELLGEAMRLLAHRDGAGLFSGLSAAATGGGPVPPWLAPSAGHPERAVRWCEAQRAAGICEQPLGSNTGPAIRDYLEECVRDGVGRLGLTRANWCAAAAHAAYLASAVPGDQILLPYRASGIETQRDAVALGLWRPVELCDRGWMPRRGDLCILQRGESGSWQRHVCLVQRSGFGSEVQTIGGNEGPGCWGETVRALTYPILGFVELPRPDAAPVGIDPSELARLVELSDDVTAGRVGLEQVMAEIDRLERLG